MESSDWQMVKKKKACRKSPRRKEPLGCAVDLLFPQLHISDPIQDLSKVTKRINETMESLKVSEFWNSFQNCLQQCPYILPVPSDECKENEHNKTTHKDERCTSRQNLDIVCYGLGNFSSCVISLHQLALLLLLLERLQIPKCQSYIFDPLFTVLEISVLQKFGLTVVSENEEGKYKVCRHTVFYMPHCGKALYNNLLWRNWLQNSLSNIIIIGNSFKGIEERLLSRILQRDYVYIQMSLQVVEEMAFPEYPEYNDIFNDTSIHWFPLEKLETLPSKAWELQNEPSYQGCEDVEIIQNKKR
ncbi:SRR1-like protein [Bombina bombina]|uniref:SRR1-like protein n=1 Tax=Bombina bombina TaxID=8345 RepID=UPI00235A814A|nr:SRR1-like protein [Bombina bombina]